MNADASLQTCLPCSCILTANMLYTCHEDLSTNFYRLLDSINLQEITSISIDRDCACYCIIVSRIFAGCQYNYVYRNYIYIHICSSIIEVRRFGYQQQTEAKILACFFCWWKRTEFIFEGNQGNMGSTVSGEFNPLRETYSLFIWRIVYLGAHENFNLNKPN